MTSPEPHETPASRRSLDRAAALRAGLLACIVLLAVLGKDAPNPHVSEASVVAPTAPTRAAASEIEPPSAAEHAPIRLHFEAPLAIDGTERRVIGTLRIETDEGDLVHEQEVTGPHVEILHVSAGAYVVRAQIAGFAREARAIRTPRDTLTIALTPIARVAGQVLGPDGLPHAATLRIVGSGIWPARAIETDAEGRYVVDDVPPGVYEIEASSGPLVSEPRRGLTVDPEASVVLGLRLSEGGFVVGQIVDGGSRPVAGAEIVASTASVSPIAHATLSDASGAFRVGPFAVGSVSLDVRAVGFVTSVAHRCETTAPCRVALAQGAIVRGRVLDQTRTPIADAWVEVVGEASDRAPIAVSLSAAPIAGLLFAPPAPYLESAVAPIAPEALGLGVTDSVPPIPLAEAVALDGPMLAPTSGTPTLNTPPLNPPSVVRSSLRTNAEGEFVVSGLPPGRVEIVARAPGHRAARSARLQLTAGRVRDDVELVLGAGGQIVGTVLDEHGRAADARIEARIEEDPIPRYLTTDARGRFAIEDVGGSVLLFVTSEGRPALERVLDVGGARRHEVEVRLDAGRRTVVARVRDPSGIPVEGALVRVETLVAGTGQPRTLVSDANGEVELTPAPPGRLSFEASHPRYASAIATGDGDAIELTLEASFSVQTTLLDAWSGAGIEDAEVTWSCLGSIACSRTTGSIAGGVVELLRVRPGTYRVEVHASGYAPWSREFTLRAPRRGEVVELDPLVLEPGLRARGDVVDRFGRPVEDAEITLEASSARARLTTRTDARGHFELEAVPAGSQTLLVAHTTAGEATVELRVRRDRDPAPLVIRMPERVDGATRNTDRARRVLGVAVAIAPDAPRIIEVLTTGARRTGLLVGDELIAIDGITVTDSVGAEALLRGAAFIPALLELRRGGARLYVRAPRELHD